LFFYFSFAYLGVKSYFSAAAVYFVVDLVWMLNTANPGFDVAFSISKDH